MPQIAFITGADRGLGYALSTNLLGQGWAVYAGQFMPEWLDLAQLASAYPGKLHIVPLDVASTESVQTAAQTVAQTTDHVDLVVNNAGILSPHNNRTIREPQVYEDMHREFDVNTLGPLRVVEAFLPLTDKSEFKRLCFVSSEAGSIEASKRVGWYGYCMSKAALNMAVKNLFNQLRPEGYTFRVYHPGWMRTYMEGPRNLKAHLEPEEAAEAALRIFLRERDEDTLALEDYLGGTYPW